MSCDTRSLNVNKTVLIEKETFVLKLLTSSRQDTRIMRLI